MMTIALMIGIIFSPLAALMAFLITYSEYSKHYVEKRTPMLMSLRSALFTFVFFMLLAVGIGLTLPYLAGGR